MALNIFSQPRRSVFIDDAGAVGMFLAPRRLSSFWPRICSRRDIGEGALATRTFAVSSTRRVAKDDLHRLYVQNILRGVMFLACLLEEGAGGRMCKGERGRHVEALRVSPPTVQH